MTTDLATTTVRIETDPATRHPVILDPPDTPPTGMVVIDLGTISRDTRRLRRLVRPVAQRAHAVVLVNGTDRVRAGLCRSLLYARSGVGLVITDPTEPT